MFVGAAMSGVPERCFSRADSRFTCKHFIRLERHVGNKHSSLFSLFVNCNQNLRYLINNFVVAEANRAWVGSLDVYFVRSYSAKIFLEKTCCPE
jgi:hypothetical protein